MHLNNTMLPEDFCKKVLILFLAIAGMFYVASSFVVAKSIADVFRDTNKDTAKVLSEFEFVRIGNLENAKGEDSVQSAERFVPVPVRNRTINVSVWGIVAGTVQTVLFLLFLGLPIGISYWYLAKPLKEFPLVLPEVLDAARSDDDEKKELAATTIARAMLLSAKRELKRIKTDDPRHDGLIQDQTELEEALQYPIGRATTVLKILDRRENQAKAVARNFAKMAGLTVAISSSAMGDGIGMFFWKARLVHDTFRIYGFRPKSWTVLQIYAHVVFAAFLAASVEDLCELLDVSELVGGFGVRVIQGAVGAVVILKGGQLARAYLTHGISAETRKTALKEFRSSAGDELKAIGNSVSNSLEAIAKGRFTDSTTLGSSMP